MPFKNPHPLYTVWQGMKRRCYNKGFKQYSSYGGRGIKVCDRWKNSFASFIQDMGERPDGYSIDRIDNDGDYSPENCRWASRRTQSLNRRDTRIVTINGVDYKAHVLSELSGLKTDTIMERAKKIDSLEELLDPERRVFTEGLRMSPNFNKTHCIHGHEYTEENTYRTPAGYRQCRQCKKSVDKKRRSKK